MASGTSGQGRPIWARRVPQHKIRQLYQNDARGIHDEELIDEVGYPILVRCESILMVTLAMKGLVTCPTCSATFARSGPKEELLDCPDCDWQLTWEDYHRSFRRKQLTGGLALPAFETFVERWPDTRSPRDKLLLIDRLIHALHANQDDIAFRMAGVNVISGSLRDVKKLFNDLAYGDENTPGIRETRENWKQAMDRSDRVLRENLAQRRARPPRTRPASRD